MLGWPSNLSEFKDFCKEGTTVQFYIGGTFFPPSPEHVNAQLQRDWTVERISYVGKMPILPEFQDMVWIHTQNFKIMKPPEYFGANRRQIKRGHA